MKSGKGAGEARGEGQGWRKGQDGAGARCAGGREAGGGCVLSNRKCFISWEWWRGARQEEAVIRNIFLTSPTSRPQSVRQAAAFGQRGCPAGPQGRGRRRSPTGTGSAAATGAPGRVAGGEQTHAAPPSRGARHGAELPRLSPECRHRAQRRGRESLAGAGRCRGCPRDTDALGEWGSAVRSWGPGLRRARGFPPDRGFPSAAKIRIQPRFLRPRWDAGVDVRESGRRSRGSGRARSINLDLHQSGSSRIRPRSSPKSRNRTLRQTRS